MHKQEPRIKILSAANGTHTAVFMREDGRELYLHSRFDPAKEAKQLVSTIPIKERTLYVVLGCGFGYHVKELLKRLPNSSRLVVIDPPDKLLSTTVRDYYKNETWIKDSRMLFYSFYDPYSACFALSYWFFKERLLSLELFNHIPSAATSELYYRQMMEVIPQKFETGMKQRLQMADLALENNIANYWQNLPVSWRIPSIDIFSRQWENKPAIIVSAGPSLSAQLEWLSKCQGQALIICVGTAAKVLFKNNIRPDFVISIDPFKENMFHFADWDTSQTTLLYYHRVWRGIPPAYQGPKFWFITRDEVDIPLSEMRDKKKFTLGGTVAFSALQFALYVKADPIILVGQDFAFHHGRTHADGCFDNDQDKFDKDNLPDGYFYIPGNNGNMVVTDHSYHSYLVHMQEHIQQNPGVRYINTSQTGAKIIGTELMTMEEVVKKFCCKKPTPINPIFKKNPQECQLHQQKKIIFLRNWEKELTTFLQEADKIHDFNKLAAKFKKLAVYRLNYPDYDDFFYAAEIRQYWFGDSSCESSAERLREHCKFIHYTIRQILEDWS